MMRYINTNVDVKSISPKTYVDHFLEGVIITTTITKQLTKNAKYSTHTIDNNSKNIVSHLKY